MPIGPQKCARTSQLVYTIYYKWHHNTTIESSSNCSKSKTCPSKKRRPASNRSKALSGRKRRHSAIIIHAILTLPSDDCVHLSPNRLRLPLPPASPLFVAENESIITALVVPIIHITRFQLLCGSGKRSYRLLFDLPPLPFLPSLRLSLLYSFSFEVAFVPLCFPLVWFLCWRIFCVLPYPSVIGCFPTRSIELRPSSISGISEIRLDGHHHTVIGTPHTNTHTDVPTRQTRHLQR